MLASLLLKGAHFLFFSPCSDAEPIQNKQAFLIDSVAELFMYLIQCIRFGSWKLRRLNRAYLYVITITNPGILILACLAY